VWPGRAVRSAPGTRCLGDDHWARAGVDEFIQRGNQERALLSAR
jgi:hypothetical protein